MFKYKPNDVVKLKKVNSRHATQGGFHSLERFSEF